MTAPLLPAGPFSVRVKEPAALGSSDQVMIDMDRFHFGTAMDAGGTEWCFTLPFSEITEMRHTLSGGLVSGILRDGNELSFRLDEASAGKGAMRTAADLVGLGAGGSNQRAHAMGSGEQAVAATLLRFEDVFEKAAERGAGPQVRRFVYLVAVAGLEMEKDEVSNVLVVRHSATDQELLHMWWYSRSRCNFLVRSGLSEMYGAEAVDALPRTKALRKMDVAETDLFLDALDTLFAVGPIDEAGDQREHGEPSDALPSVRDVSIRTEADGGVEEFIVPMPGSGFHGSASTAPILTDEELAAVLGTLAAAFDDAAVCGVEPQARRFAELTASADLDVRWVEELRALSALWPKTGQALFLLRWNLEGQVTGHLGIAGYEKIDYGQSSGDPVEKAFGLRYTKEAGTLPEMDYPSTMSTAEINRYTESFLDWLEAFLASHAIPSRQAEAIRRTDEDLHDRAFMAALYSTMSFLWIGVIWYSIVWSQGGLGSTLGDVGAEVALLGVFYLVVPVWVLVIGVRVKRAIRRSGSDEGIDLARGAIILAVLAITLAVVLTFAELIRST